MCLLLGLPTSLTEKTLIFSIFNIPQPGKLNKQKIYEITSVYNQPVLIYVIDLANIEKLSFLL